MCKGRIKGENKKGRRLKVQNKKGEALWVGNEEVGRARPVGWGKRGKVKGGEKREGVQVGKREKG